MRKVIFAISAALFLFVLGVIQASPTLAAEKAKTAPVSEESQTPPPPGVSPADPAMGMPNMSGCCCPRCGAAFSRHAWGAKSPYGRPQLGPNAGGPGPKAERTHPGRYGRAGEGECCAAGPRHGMRGGFDGRRMRGEFEDRGMRGGNAAERMIRHAEDLKLTDEQISTLEKLSYETQKTLVGLRAEIEKETLEIKNLLRSGNDDLAAIKVHLTAVSQARADIQAARIENLFEAKKVLTEKQKKAIKEDFPGLGTMLD